MIPQRIVFTDRTADTRSIVEIDGNDVALTFKCFKYLLRLAWAARTTPDGWIHRFGLEPGDNQGRYLYRLRRQEIQRAGINWDIYENDQIHRRVRLIANRKTIIVSGGLCQSDDSEIAAMARDMVRIKHKRRKR